MKCFEAQKLNDYRICKLYDSRTHNDTGQSELRCKEQQINSYSVQVISESEMSQVSQNNRRFASQNLGTGMTDLHTIHYNANSLFFISCWFV